MGMGVPLSAREQLLEAARLGHELSYVRREFEGDIPPKIKVKCTCGYESTWRRSEKAVGGTMAWHLGKVLAEKSDTPRRNAPPVSDRVHHRGVG